MENVDECWEEKSQNKVLENEIKTLEKDLSNSLNKYAEAIGTLKEVQTTVSV